MAQEFDRREGHLQRVANEMFMAEVEPRLHAVETETAALKIGQAKIDSSVDLGQTAIRRALRRSEHPP